MPACSGVAVRRPRWCSIPQSGWWRICERGVWSTVHWYSAGATHYGSITPQ